MTGTLSVSVEIQRVASGVFWEAISSELNSIVFLLIFLMIQIGHHHEASTSRWFLLLLPLSLHTGNLQQLHVKLSLYSITAPSRGFGWLWYIERSFPTGGHRPTTESQAVGVQTRCVSSYLCPKISLRSLSTRSDWCKGCHRCGPFHRPSCMNSK